MNDEAPIAIIIILLLLIIIIKIKILTLNAAFREWTIFERVRLPRLYVTNIVTNSVTYFQFQILHLVCFYAMVD